MIKLQINEPRREKNGLRVSDQVRHKPVCVATHDGWKLEKKRDCTICVAKTKAQIRFAVTVKLISAFVFATRIEQFLYFLNLKFPGSSHLLCLYSWVCVGPVQKPHCWFSHDAAQLYRKREMHETRSFVGFFLLLKRYFC